MKLISVINLLLFIALVYLIFVRPYILGRREFKCLRCGKCCKLTVALSEEEIKKIKKAGYKDFLIKNNKLKKVNGYCVFLTLDKGVTSCKLENSAKPRICRNYPKITGLFGKEHDIRCSSSWKFSKKV
jgi:Fe-S-cluster containining protein